MSGEWSQKGDTSLGDRVLLVDATDDINAGATIPPTASGEGVLLLADGSLFTGKFFGAKVWGE